MVFRTLSQKHGGVGYSPLDLAATLHCSNTSGPIIVSWYSTHAPPPHSHRSDSVALPAAPVRRGRLPRRPRVPPPHSPRPHPPPHPQRPRLLPPHRHAPHH